VFTTRTLLRAKMGSVPSLVDDLRAELAPDRVRAEPLELSLYGHDASIVTGGHAAVVCFPLSTDEVQSCVRVARAHGRPFTLRGAFVGSEGTLGVATRIAVRLTPNPPAVRTLLVDFLSVDDAAACVSAIIAGGLVPAALEMVAGDMISAIEEYVHAGYPTDAAAVLLVEVDGLPAFVDDATRLVAKIAEANGARWVRVAADETERQLL